MPRAKKLAQRNLDIVVRAVGAKKVKQPDVPVSRRRRNFQLATKGRLFKVTCGSVSDITDPKQPKTTCYFSTHPMPPEEKVATVLLLLNNDPMIFNRWFTKRNIPFLNGREPLKKEAETQASGLDRAFRAIRLTNYPFGSRWTNEAVHGATVRLGAAEIAYRAARTREMIVRNPGAHDALARDIRNALALGPRRPKFTYAVTATPVDIPEFKQNCIYLDVQSIGNLYAQTADQFEVEITETRKQEGKGTVGFKAEFGNLLSTLTGIKGWDAETRLETIRGHIEEAKRQLSTDDKLARVSEYLIQSSQCYEDFTIAANNARVPGAPVFLRIEQKFDEPDFFPGGRGIAAVNESEAMVFRIIEPDYDHSDNYFKRMPYRCIMSARLEKCWGVRDFMGRTSRQAIACRRLEGKNIPLGVFGHLIRFNSSVCQIKPFAIWLAKNRL